VGQLLTRRVRWVEVLLVAVGDSERRRNEGRRAREWCQDQSCLAVLSKLVRIRDQQIVSESAVLMEPNLQKAS